MTLSKQSILEQITSGTEYKEIVDVIGDDKAAKLLAAIEKVITLPEFWTLLSETEDFVLHINKLDVLISEGIIADEGLLTACFSETRIMKSLAAKMPPMMPIDCMIANPIEGPLNIAKGNVALLEENPTMRSFKPGLLEEMLAGMKLDVADLERKSIAEIMEHKAAPFFWYRFAMYIEMK